MFTVLVTNPRIVIQLLSSQFNVSSPKLTPAMVSYYSKILRNLPLQTARAEKTRSFLGSSPVKMLSSFLSGGSGNNTPETSFNSKYSKQPPMLHRNNSQHSFLSSLGSLRGKGDQIATEEIRPENPLVRLEQTFTGYVAALQDRKGAIIGRTLLNRSMADELSVNDLYNRLIESPYDFDASSDVSTEVIFVAFEKFLRIAWTEQMGPVMSIQSLDTLQDRANKKMPGDFADFVNFLFGDMAPQNRRAFTSLIKLLADLLDGCGNDSDRGALTLAFAELLVSDGSAPNYINLLDRLVEDCDRIFEEPGLNHSFNLGSDAVGSINSAIRGGGKSYTPSLTSNTSSLRRKFADTLLRTNSSKDERPSVWRTLSKHRNPATGEGFPKPPSLGRTGSMDDGSGSKKAYRRPISRDRPPVAGAFDDGSRPTSSHRMDFPLDTIGEPANEVVIKSPRRKRRSSLSDLKSLMAAASLGDDDALQPLQVANPTSEKLNSSPRATTPSRIPVSPNMPPGLRSPRHKENDPLNMSHAHGEPAKFESPGKTPSPTKRNGHSKTLSTSNIPTLKPSRPGTSGADSPTRSPTRSAKLRLQSPQKLRERLQTEKKNVDEVDASLKSELSKIGEEMARVNTASLSGSQSVDLRRLASSIKTLEDRIPVTMQELSDKHAAIQHDVDTNVKSAESKVKAIDQLYKEAIAENELLYEKFHGELGKIVRALKGKGKEDKEELVEKLKQQGEETARMKKENARLKREMVSLRAALKATE